MPGSTCGGLTGATTRAASVTICVVMTGATGALGALEAVAHGPVVVAVPAPPDPAAATQLAGWMHGDGRAKFAL